MRLLELLAVEAGGQFRQLPNHTGGATRPAAVGQSASALNRDARVAYFALLQGYETVTNGAVTVQVPVLSDADLVGP